MLGWLRRSMGSSKPGMSAAIGALDEFVNPSGARAATELKEQNERVLPMPSPGDRLLADGKVVITPTSRPADDD